jgi:hypothetical protein
LVHATCIGGLLKSEYAPDREIILIIKDEVDHLFQDCEASGKYE